MLVWASSSISATVGRRSRTAIGIHLLDDDAAVLDPLARDDLEAVEELEGLRPPVGLDEADHDVRASFPASMALLEHAVRLADAGRHAEVDAQPSAAARRLRADAREHLVARRADVERVALRDRSLEQAVQVEVELEDVHAGSPRSPNSGCSVCRATIARTASAVMPRAAATRATWYSADAGLMSGSSPDAEVVIRSTGIGTPGFAAWYAATASVDAVDQVRVRRAEVRAGRAAGVVAQRVVVGGAGRRRAAPEVRVAGERLPDQRRADGPAVLGDEHRPVGLVREGDLGDRGHDGGVGDAGDQRHHEEEGERRPQDAAQERGHRWILQARWRAETTTSIALIPMNGAMMPPRP